MMKYIVYQAMDTCICNKISSMHGPSLAQIPRKHWQLDPLLPF